MKSLKQAWKTLQFKMAACDAFAPPPSVMDEMKKDGWQFETENIHPFATRSGAMITASYIITKTPEGNYVNDGDKNDPDYQRYREARTNAAKHVFGMK